MWSSSREWDASDTREVAVSLCERYKFEPILSYDKIVVKSDGGSSSYYDFDLVEGEGVKKIRTKDLIRDFLGNDFDFGEALKALRRLYLVKTGGAKEGSTADYEINKIKFFLNEIKEHL